MNQKGYLYELIAKRAYELWEQRGKPSGSGEADWLRAEKEIRHHFSLDSTQPSYLAFAPDPSEGPCE